MEQRQGLGTQTFWLGMKTDRIEVDNNFFISLSIYFCRMEAGRILPGCSFGDGFFRMSEIVRSRTGVEADADYYSRIIHACMYLFMPMDNSRTNTINNIAQKNIYLTIYGHI